MEVLCLKLKIINLKLKHVRHRRRIKMNELKEALAACVAADEAVKTGRLNDVLSVELLIIERSR